MSDESECGLYKCKKCDRFIPYRSLLEHNAMKHPVKAQGQPNDNDSVSQSSSFFDGCNVLKVDEIESLESFSDLSESGRIAPNSQPSNDRSSYSVADISIGLLPPKTQLNPTKSGDLFRAKQQLPPLLFEPTGEIDTPFRRPRIPTASELFGLRSRSENRPPNMISNQSTPTANVGLARRSASTSRAQTEPDIEVSCEFCFQLMPKSCLFDHFQRKHASTIGSSKNEANDDFMSTTQHEQAKDIGQRGNGKFPRKNRSKKIGKKVSDKEKAQDFVYCKLCPGFMHVDYIPGHLVRKHHDDDWIGVAPAQFTDDQINAWLNDGTVFVKDGAFLIN